MSKLTGVQVTTHTAVKPGALALDAAQEVARLNLLAYNDGGHRARLALADLRALMAERDTLKASWQAADAKRTEAVQHAERLAAALEYMDKWESDGRPVGVHIAMQTVRAALEVWRERGSK